MSEERVIALIIIFGLFGSALGYFAVKNIPNAWLVGFGIGAFAGLALGLILERIDQSKRVVF